jgi:hypothetical protein
VVFNTAWVSITLLEPWHSTVRTALEKATAGEKDLCAVRSRLPKLEINTINGGKLVLDGYDFIYKDDVPGAHQLCYIAVGGGFPWYQGGFGLGTNFLARRYSVFDLEGKRVKCEHKGTLISSNTNNLIQL